MKFPNSSTRTPARGPDWSGMLQIVHNRDQTARSQCLEATGSLTEEHGSLAYSPYGDRTKWWTLSSGHGCRLLPRRDRHPRVVPRRGRHHLVAVPNCRDRRCDPRSTDLVLQVEVARLVNGGTAT